MPAPLKVDWLGVQAMFLRGMDPKEISEQTGISYPAIRQRIARGKWKQLRDKAEQSVSQRVSDELVETAIAHQNRALKLKNKVLEAVEKRNFDELTEDNLEKVARTVNIGDQIGRRAHGLDRQDQQTIKVGLFLPVNIVRVESQDECEKPAQVVDIQAETRDDNPSQ